MDLSMTVYERQKRGFLMLQHEKKMQNVKATLGSKNKRRLDKLDALKKLEKGTERLRYERKLANGNIVKAIVAISNRKNVLKEREKKVARARQSRKRALELSRKYKQQRLKQENLKVARRIVGKKSNYSSKKWSKHWERQQLHKKMVSKVAQFKRTRDMVPGRKNWQSPKHAVRQKAVDRKVASVRRIGDDLGARSPTSRSSPAELETPRRKRAKPSPKLSPSAAAAAASAASPTSVGSVGSPLSGSFTGRIVADLPDASRVRLIVSSLPAAGRDTQCELIAKRYGLVHISASDLIQSQIKDSKSSAGQRARKAVEERRLVSDNLVTKLVLRRLKQPDCAEQGWVVDGFPRTVKQAEAMVRAGYVADAFVFLRIPEAKVLDRVVGRLWDPKSATLYHRKYYPPSGRIVTGRCVVRPQDKVRVVKKEVERFRDEIKQMRAFFDNFAAVTADGTRDEVFVKVERVIERSRKAGDLLLQEQERHEAQYEKETKLQAESRPRSAPTGFSDDEEYDDDYADEYSGMDFEAEDDQGVEHREEGVAEERINEERIDEERPDAGGLADDEPTVLKVARDGEEDDDEYADDDLAYDDEEFSDDLEVVEQRDDAVEEEAQLAERVNGTAGAAGVEPARPAAEENTLEIGARIVDEPGRAGTDPSLDVGGEERLSDADALESFNDLSYGADDFASEFGPDGGQSQASTARRRDQERQRELQAQRAREEERKQEAQLRAEQERREREQREVEERERHAREQEERRIKEEEERRKAEEEQRLQREAEEQRLREEEERRLAAEERARQERERLEKEKAEREAREAEERERKRLEELKKAEEAELERQREVAQLEEEKKAQLERERREREEQERRERERIEREKKEQLEREERERLEREEKERLEREERERLEREEKERLECEEKERLEREDKERSAREEKERLKREEKEQLERQEKERAMQEEERLKQVQAIPDPSEEISEDAKEEAPPSEFDLSDGNGGSELLDEGIDDFDDEVDDGLDDGLDAAATEKEQPSPPVAQASFEEENAAAPIVTEDDTQSNVTQTDAGVPAPIADARSEGQDVKEPPLPMQAEVASSEAEANGANADPVDAEDLSGGFVAKSAEGTPRTAIDEDVQDSGSARQSIAAGIGNLSENEDDAVPDTLESKLEVGIAEPSELDADQGAADSEEDLADSQQDAGANAEDYRNASVEGGAGLGIAEENVSAGPSDGVELVGDGKISEVDDGADAPPQDQNVLQTPDTVSPQPAEAESPASEAGIDDGEERAPGQDAESEDQDSKANQNELAVIEAGVIKARANAQPEDLVEMPPLDRHSQSEASPVRDEFEDENISARGATHDTTPEAGDDLDETPELPGSTPQPSELDAQSAADDFVSEVKDDLDVEPASAPNKDMDPAPIVAVDSKEDAAESTTAPLLQENPQSEANEEEVATEQSAEADGPVDAANPVEGDNGETQLVESEAEEQPVADSEEKADAPEAKSGIQDEKSDVVPQLPENTPVAAPKEPVDIRPAAADMFTTDLDASADEADLSLSDGDDYEDDFD